MRHEPETENEHAGADAAIAPALAIDGNHVIGLPAAARAQPRVGFSDRLRLRAGDLAIRSARGVFVVELFLVAFAAFVLVAGRTGSIAAAATTAGPVTAVWLFSRRLAVRVVPRAIGPATPVVLGSLIAFVILSAASLWIPSPLDARTLAVLTLVTGLLLFLTMGVLVERLARPTRVFLVGADESAAALAQEVWTESPTRFEVVAVAGGDAATLPGVGELESLDEIAATVLRVQPDLVVVAVERGRPQVFQQLLEVADAGFRVVGLPEFYEHAFGRVPVRQLSAAWFMSVLHLYQPIYTRIAKRTFDVVVASLALLLIAPVFLLVLLAVGRRHGSPIFKQLRLGEGGRTFTIYKFRTMYRDAEQPGQAVWATRGDPRVTRVGRMLRATRLDELPQLWNVIRGDMSIVGPRPERPEFLRRLVDEVPYWGRRHLLKPGITGWAQIHSGYAANAEQTEVKLSYDLWYLRHRSFLTDLAICAKTLRTLVSGSGAH